MTNKTTERDAQTKARVTRLSKKSVEELINIILRKDSVEKKYAEKIKSQAAELSRIYNSLASYKEDIAKLEYDTKVQQNNIAELSRQHDNYVTESIKDYEDIDKKYRIFKCATIVLGIIACTLCVLYMI